MPKGSAVGHDRTRDRIEIDAICPALIVLESDEDG